jgi:hypothetical protein
MYSKDHFSAVFSCCAREKSSAHNSTITQYFSKKYHDGRLTGIAINAIASLGGGAAW